MSGGIGAMTRRKLISLKEVARAAAQNGVTIWEMQDQLAKQGYTVHALDNGIYNPADFPAPPQIQVPVRRARLARRRNPETG